MNQSALLSIVLASILSLLHPTSGMASSNPGFYRLPWDRAGEILQYHSCGCADSCWIAELKDLKTRKMKFMLRCDCEKLFSQKAHDKEKLESPNCKEFECNQDQCKNELISRKMKELTGRLAK